MDWKKEKEKEKELDMVRVVTDMKENGEIIKKKEKIINYYNYGEIYEGNWRNGKQE